MRARTSRAGYTLVELLVAATISVLVVAGVAGALGSTIRLVETTMAESEFALAARELRDKLLFHAAPNRNGRHFCGLWSLTNGTGVVEGNAKIHAKGIAVGTTLLDESPQTVQLLLDRWGSGYGFRNDSDRSAPNWLRPAGLPLRDDFATSVRVTETGTDRRGQTYPRRYRIDLTYRYHPRYLPESNTDFDFVRTESVVVPVLGKIHRHAFTQGGTEL